MIDYFNFINKDSGDVDGEENQSKGGLAARDSRIKTFCE